MHVHQLHISQKVLSANKVVLASAVSDAASKCLGRPQKLIVLGCCICFILSFRLSDREYTTLDKISLRKIRILSLARYTIGGPAASQPPLLPWGGRKLPQNPRSRGQGPPDLLRAQARIARTAREHEAMARNMMSTHTCSDRPFPTCKTSIMVTATIFTVFKADTKETTRELARPKAATPLLWWRPKAATFVYWL